MRRGIEGWDGLMTEWMWMLTEVWVYWWMTQWRVWMDGWTNRVYGYSNRWITDRWLDKWLSGWIAEVWLEEHRRLIFSVWSEPCPQSEGELHGTIRMSSGARLVAEWGRAGSQLLLQTADLPPSPSFQPSFLAGMTPLTPLKGRPPELHLQPSLRLGPLPRPRLKAKAALPSIRTHTSQHALGQARGTGADRQQEGVTCRENRAVMSPPASRTRCLQTPQEHPYPRPCPLLGDPGLPTWHLWASAPHCPQRPPGRPPALPPHLRSTKAPLSSCRCSGLAAWPWQRQDSQLYLTADKECGVPVLQMEKLNCRKVCSRSQGWESGTDRGVADPQSAGLFRGKDSVCCGSHGWLASKSHSFLLPAEDWSCSLVPFSPSD